MSVNIGSMLRALMGEMQAEGTRVMELRVGQIVRGVLLEMLDNHEALMNINGVQVRAKLETELPVGSGTLLQVLPGSGGGTVLLKPLAEPADLPLDEGFKNVLKSFGLPDQKWSHELMRGLKRDGYPIGKHTAAFFHAAAAMKPAGADIQSWMGAADVAFRRGLPASEETIAALRQALFGSPLHEEIAGLASALKGWQETAGAKTLSALALAGRLQTLLAEGEALLSHGEAQLLNGADKAGTVVRAGDASVRQPSAGQQAPVGSREVQGALTGLSADKATVSAASAETAESAVTRTARAMDGLRAGGAEARPVVQSGRHSVEVSAAANAEDGGADPSGERPPVVGREAAAGTQNAAPRGDAVWIGRLLQWLGAGHEFRLLQSAAELRAPDGQTMQLQGPGAADPSVSETARTAADSLKSVLLSLAASDEIPPALREAAQSVVNQITGQQLLLSSERQPNAPFSMMTLFVPMKGQNGDTTATVHVQTRRSRKGEWDTDNCRLLFDLRMRHLGDTVVDVQVVDRIVSLKLMNDYPGMTDLVERARDELQAGLRSAGFQLLSMTAAPLPSHKELSSLDNGKISDRQEAANTSAYTSKPYKGVDFRV